MDMKYTERPLNVQIKIDQLLRCYPYPKAYYEKMSNKEIIGFHKSKLGEMAQMTIDSILLKEQKPTQLSLF